MITPEEFDKAIKLISDYKLQFEKVLSDNNIYFSKVDIQKKINKNTYFILKDYCRLELQFDLKWDDLKEIDVSILKNIDFTKLRRYRGFGEIAQIKLKEVIDSCMVYHDS